MWSRWPGEFEQKWTRRDFGHGWERSEEGCGSKKGKKDDQVRSGGKSCQSSVNLGTIESQLIIADISKCFPYNLQEFPNVLREKLSSDPDWMPDLNAPTANNALP